MLLTNRSLKNFLETLHCTKSKKLLLSFGGPTNHFLTKFSHKLLQVSFKVLHLLFYYDLEVLTAVSLIAFGL